LADNVNANIRVDLDTSDALASLRNLQNQISLFNKSVIQSNATAVAAQKSMLSTLSAQIDSTRQFTASMVNVETSVSRLGRTIDKNKLSLGEYFRYGVASSKSFGRVFGREHTAIMELAADRVKRLQTQYVAMGQAQNGVMKAMAIRPMNLFNADAAVAIQRQQIFNKLLHDGSTSLINFGKNTQWAGRQLMVGFTVPLTIFGGMAGKIFMDLERQIVNFRRVYGDATTPLEETNGMILQIQELAKEFTKYGIAVRDTIALASDAAAAGAQGKDLLAATAEATRLSTLGMIDQQQALTATIALQSAFGLSAEKLAESVNFLNAVENQTVVSLADITEAIPKVAPVIKGLGGDVEDLAVFMAALREGGVTAAEGANALKSGLASLINPTKNAREQLAKVGINIDAILKTNKGDIQGTVRAFGDALMTLGKFERQQTLAKVFGKYQFARLGALFENISRDASQAQRVVDLTGMSVEELGNLAEKELGAIEESIGVKFTGAVERLKLAIAPIGEAFLRVATPIIEFATKLAEKFNELGPNVKNFVVVLAAGLGVVVPTIIMLIGLFANFAGNAVKGLSLMNNFFNRLKGGAGTLDYLSGEQLDAAAAAASLEGQTSSLTGALNVQRNAVDQLAKSYGRYITAAQAAASNLPQGFRGPAKRMASGGLVSGSGNKDTEPALLTPGEFVMNRGATEKFGPILDAMNRGTVKGLQEGSRSSKQSGAASRQFKSGAFVLRGLGANIGAGGAGSGILSDILGVSARSIADVTSLFVSEISQSAGVTVSAINKEIKAWQQQNRSYLEQLNRQLADAIINNDVKEQQRLLDEANSKFVADMKRSSGPLSKFATEAERRYPELSADLENTQRIIRSTKLNLSDANQSAQFFEENMKKTALLSKLGKPGTYQPQARVASGALPFFGSGIGMGIPAQLIDPRVRATAGRETSMGLSAAQSAALYRAGTSAEHVMKTPQQVAKEARTLAVVASKSAGGTIIKEMQKASVRAGSVIGPSVMRGASAASPPPWSTQLGMWIGEGIQQGMTTSLADVSARLKQQMTGPNRGFLLPAGPSSPFPQGNINAPMNNMSNQTNQAAGAMAKVKVAAGNLGRSLMKGGGKLSGAMFALDGLVFGLSMMDNSIGQFAQNIMPVVFGLHGLKMVLPLLASPVGLLVGALAALTAVVIVGRNRIEEALDEAVNRGKEAATSMKDVASIGKIFGKSLRTLNVQKIGFQTAQKTRAQEYFATEEGAAQISALSEQRATMGREKFTLSMAQDIATAAITQGLSGKQIDAYISAVAEKLNDKQLYYNLRGELVELLDPENKEDILKNGLLIKVKAETATEFLKESMQIPKTTLDQLRADIGQIYREATPKGVMETAVSEADRLAQEIQKLEQERVDLANAIAEEGPGGPAETRWKELTYIIIPELTRQMNSASREINYNNVELEDRAMALENATKWGAIFGEKLSLSNQFLAYQKQLLDSGKIKQKEYNKQMAEANKVIAQNTVSMKQAAKSLQGLEDGGEALGAFMKQLGDQIFAGLDEELRTKISDALASIKDVSASIDLQVAYAQGSITTQDLIDLSSVVDSFPPFARTDLIIAYGKGSLTSEELVYIKDNADALVGLDGTQIDFLISVSGLDNMIAAINLMKQVNALGPITDANFMQYSALQNQLSALAKDIPQPTMGDTGDDGPKPPPPPPGGDGEKTKSWLEQLIADTEATLSLLPGMINKIKSKYPNIPVQILEAIGVGEEGQKRAQEVLNMSANKFKEFMAKYRESLIRTSQSALGIKVAQREQQDLAKMQLQQTTVDGRKVEKQVIEDILQDEGAIAAILSNNVKKINEYVREYRKLQEEQDPVKEKIEEITKENEKIIKAIDKQIKKQQDVVKVIQDQIDALEKKNEEDQWSIRGKEREKELIDRQIESLERANEMDQRRIDVLQRQDELRNREADALNYELDAMSSIEEKIKETYQQRIDALDKVTQLNDHILQQERQRLGLSQALSEGDIYAATAAAQEMRQTQTQFAQQQVRAGLEQGMENAIAGLTTSEGLTREQAEARIKVIKDQSYQTSLLIRDIEDRIFERNQQIIPLKDQQYQLDLQIREISDRIFEREGQIYDIRTKQLDPAQQVLDKLNEQRNRVQETTDEVIDTYKATADLADVTKDATGQADNLAAAWHDVAKQIDAANKLAKEEAAQLIAPQRKKGETEVSYADRVARYNASLAGIRERRDRAVAAALASGRAKMGTGMYGGGMVKKYGSGGMMRKYAYGGSVLGVGSRDSIPAMLTPGEFVIRKAMVDKYGKPLISALNQGSFAMPTYKTSESTAGNVSVKSENNTNVLAPMYNNYSVNVSVSNANASADEIANKTIMKIKQMQDTRVRGSRGY